MKAIISNTEKLVLGVNYEIRDQCTWDGFEWKSYNAKIGNTSFSCTSFESLQHNILSYHFQTEEERLIEIRAVRQFGTSA